MTRCVAVFLCCFFLFADVCFAGKRYVAAQDQVYNAVQEKDLARNLDYLTGTLCAGRASGTAGATLAANFVADVFKKHRMPYTVQHFSCTDLTGHNIIGFFQGNKKHPCEKYVLVMSYYDGKGTIKGKLYPGADANASGLVALTSLAELFPLHKLLTGDVFSKSVIFAALDGHNRNLAGSQALFSALKEGSIVDPTTGKAVKLSQIDLVVNIDQIGSVLAPLTDGREDYLILLGTRTFTREEIVILRTVNWFYNMNLDLGYTYYGSDSFTKLFERLSDQKPFVNDGKRFLFVTSGITFATNKTSDTVDGINIPVFRKRILYLFRVLEKLISQ